MRRIAAFLVVVGLVASSSRAHADDEGRNPTLAQVLSGAGTAVSAGLVLSGFVFTDNNGNQFNKPLLYAGIASAVITPSLGEWYAGEWLTYGMAARVIGAGVATFALTNEMKTQACDNATTAGQTCTTLKGAGVALLGVAAIAFVGGMAYDVRDAGPAVDRWNERHGIMVAPTALATPQGNLAGGLAVMGSW
jgi:hypothetical protein